MGQFIKYSQLRGTAVQLFSSFLRNYVTSFNIFNSASTKLLVSSF